MEQLDYNLPFRWFVGLSPDDRVWDATSFTKNRERLQQGKVFAGAGFSGSAIGKDWRSQQPSGGRLHTRRRKSRPRTTRPTSRRSNAQRHPANSDAPITSSAHQ